MLDLEARVVDWLNEISQWAPTGIGKGILDVSMEVDDDNRVMSGYVVVNNNDGVIHLKGYMAGPKDASDLDNYDPLMGDMWEIIDFDVHVGKNGSSRLEPTRITQRNKWQKATGWIKEVMKLASARRRFREGVMPMEYHQSMNRKTILGEYNNDGGIVY